jgi:hypothetical protein
MPQMALTPAAPTRGGGLLDDLRSLSTMKSFLLR